jgi:hypothetical protein
LISIGYDLLLELSYYIQGRERKMRNRGYREVKNEEQRREIK